MTNYYTLSPWKSKGIDDWGAYESEDYKKFARTYKNFLKRMCKANNWELVNFSTGHYYCSWFVFNGKNYIYCSFSDVRYFSKSWYNSILYRTAQNDHDYTGGTNNYATIKELETKLIAKFKMLEEK